MRLSDGWLFLQASGPPQLSSTPVEVWFHHTVLIHQQAASCMNIDHYDVILMHRNDKQSFIEGAEGRSALGLQAAFHGSFVRCPTT